MDSALRAALEHRLGPIRAVRPVAGGDINLAYGLTLVGGESLFVKANPGAPSDLFTREAEGLRWLGETRALRVPEVIACAEAPPHFLVLEWLDSGARAADFDAALGAGLAALHRYPAAGWVGLPSNYIGSLPQSNASCETWQEFFVTRRLSPMLKRALDGRRGAANWSPRFESLFRLLPELLVPEPPARVHGDLWAGNVHTGPQGEACLIDPAAYCGHREVDLAMMRLFGGFSERVFAAYEAHYPTLPGASQRMILYQLYPLLVHVVLFGGHYAASVESALRRLGV